MRNSLDFAGTGKNLILGIVVAVVTFYSSTGHLWYGDVMARTEGTEDAERPAWNDVSGKAFSIFNFQFSISSQGLCYNIGETVKYSEE